MKTKQTYNSKSSALIGVLCGLILSLTQSVAQADNTYWSNSGSGNWSDIGNWNNGVPGSYDLGYINNGGTAVLSSGAALANYVIVANNTNDSGSLLLSGNALLTVNYFYTGYYGGTAHTVISGSAQLTTFGSGGNSLTIGGNVSSLLLTDNARINTYRTSVTAKDQSEVTISGSAHWNNDGSFSISGANNILNLNGGTLQAQSFSVGGGGILAIGGDGSGKLVSSDGASPLTISGGGLGTVRFAHTGDINFANVISGTNISVEQNGPGSTTLTADNAIKSLSVSGGILNIDRDATLTLQSGSATVNNGGTLGGAGTLTGGLLTVESGGVLSTTLTLENGITLEAGAIIDYAGNENGLLVSGGIITVDNGIIVDLSVLTETGTYTVLDWNGATAGGGISETSFTAANLDAGITGSFTVANNRLIFTAGAIPEPSTYFLLGIGLGFVGLLKLRRRQPQG